MVTAPQRLRALRTRVLMRFRPPTRWRFVRDLLLLVVLFTCLTCYLSYIGSFLQNTVPTEFGDISSCIRKVFRLLLPRVKTIIIINQDRWYTCVILQE
ncbi:hypothetical protein HNY73_021691 [Argiope bruennichi]|uniref:Uncharacterized protein n=1 Tax=Argiope bruennichi TaxID=94029 RepID=A0A8T0E218_ARGBR|nr:hypothetical protein HNY73_021691 [Argiope bruennichi]